MIAPPTSVTSAALQMPSGNLSIQNVDLIVLSLDYPTLQRRYSLWASLSRSETIRCRKESYTAKTTYGGASTSPASLIWLIICAAWCSGIACGLDLARRAGEGILAIARRPSLLNTGDAKCAMLDVVHRMTSKATLKCPTGPGSQKLSILNTTNHSAG